MLLMLLVILWFAFYTTVVAQPPLSIVCVAGQCFQGISNTTIGATLSGPGGTPQIQLLPDQYSSTTNPQLLHNLLTSRLSTLVGSAGFRNASLTSLPLNLQLEPGVAVYSQSLYSGQASFAKLPDSPVSNTSIPLSARSIAIAPNVWIAISNNNNRLILWDSVPDTSQLPSIGALSLLDIQSSTCSPPCSGPSVCSTSGTCTCQTGFTGSSCESCDNGYFGPTCQPCPEECTDCDQGMSGSGRCLTPPAEAPPVNCNCLHGVCEDDGTCTCNSGWEKSPNGTACAACEAEFFLSTTGDCQVCGFGCVQCNDGTGECATCGPGFTKDGNDKTKCIEFVTKKDDNTYCPRGSFAKATQCYKCSSACATCTGPTENECTLCATGTYFLNGLCVAVDGDGVCDGRNGLVANNKKKTCDSCGANCISCSIPNFGSTSTIDQLQCTRCLPGFSLVDGKCMGGCSSGMFPSEDNKCTGCSPSCSTCAGSPDYCLTCPSGQVASSGKCMSSCPSDTFSSSGTCIKCHPDCSTCSGASFNQCNSCPPSRPVLTGGRCLSTCSKNQYLDKATSSCQTCDPSCSSCSGPGSRSCLACSSYGQVLRGGSCVSMDCQESRGTIPGLGVCLSELVQIQNPTSESESVSGTIPLPIATGLTVPTSTNPRLKLKWWQIFLIVLGSVFILLMFIWCWRRRARNYREMKTKSFAEGKNLNGIHGWLIRLGLRLFHSEKDYMHSEKFDSYDRHSLKIHPIEDDILLKKLAPPKSKKKSRATKERDSMDDLIAVYSQFHKSSAPSDDRHRQSDDSRRLKDRTDRDSRSLYRKDRTDRESRSLYHKDRTDRDSRSLYRKQRTRSGPREVLQRDPVPALPRNLPLNNEGVPVDNRFHMADQQTYVHRVIDTGVSPHNHPTPSRFPTYSNGQPIGSTSAAVPQLQGGHRMPATVTGNGQGVTGNGQGVIGNGQGPYMLPMAQAMPPFHVPHVIPQPMAVPYSTSPPRNPFRHGS